MSRRRRVRTRIKKIRGKNKKIKNAKSLELDNGLKFRSKLELFTYQKLLENKIKDFKYEEEKFVLNDGFEFNNESYESYERKLDNGKVKQFGDVDHKIRPITYLPDFTHINHSSKTGWILEVKGYANDTFPLKWKMFKKWLHDNNYNLTLFKPNNQQNVLKCIQIIKERYYE